MITPRFTADELRSLVAYDRETGEMTWRTKTARSVVVGRSVGGKVKNGYVQASILGQHLMVHRLAWYYVTGDWPDFFIDHINGVTDDNRFANLRPCTTKQNRANSKKPVHNKSGYKGVSFHRGTSRWRARIGIDGKDVTIGYFVTREEAAEARKKEAERLHGEFSRHS